MKQTMILVVTITIGFTLLFTACNSNSETSDEAVSTVNEVVEEEKEIVFSDNFKSETEKGVANLMETEGSGLLDEIEVLDLISYMSGYYVGHTFPCIYYNPEDKILVVSAPAFQQTFQENQLDEALASYRVTLADKGYIEGEKPVRETVTMNGEEMVYMSMDELLPDASETKKHFTAEQYDFLYSDLLPWAGYAYLSGLVDTGRDYPLMYGAGYEENARLNVLGKDLAHEFSFDQLDSAFTIYSDYIKERLE